MSNKRDFIRGRGRGLDGDKGISRRVGGSGGGSKSCCEKLERGGAGVRRSGEGKRGWG